ncbi:phospho-N-acetylmuramoyl-pentapeptide-transferase [Bengtsoniella intestinalis]|uniref:phospho-N-acetylmuramoyl-pentapeptide- transferase n=1 Tax=Bengtsoniella intestinalis TaxID=3073143 RepID=UPI00391F916B
MTTQALARTIAIMVGFIATWLLGKWVIPMLQRFKAGQSIRQDGPTWHNSKSGTPTMGGIMFILGGGIACICAHFAMTTTGDYTHFYIFIFALVFGIIGFIDDYFKVKKKQNLGLHAREKFVLQLAAAVGFIALMRYEGLVSNTLVVPFVGISFTLPWVAYMVFAAFVIVGTVNAVNITDGVDGLAATVTYVVMMMFALIGTYLSIGGVEVFGAAFFAALMGFLFYNRYPAKVFMGDTGSLFLGGAVAALAFAIDRPLLLIPMGIIYIVETLSVILQVGYFKATHGKRLFKMAPIHHHFEMCGWKETKVVTVFFFITLLGCILAVYDVIMSVY